MSRATAPIGSETHIRAIVFKEDKANFTSLNASNTISAPNRRPLKVSLTVSN